MQLEVSLGPDVLLRSAPGPSVEISPNGERLVFVSNGRLMTRRLEHHVSTALVGTEGLTSFFFSPDSQSVAFVAQGKLKRLALDGTSIVTMADAPEGRGGTWAEAVCENGPGGKGSRVWTRKRTGIPVDCQIQIGDRELHAHALGVEDESDGNHPRHTVWSWSAGVGESAGCNAG